MQSYPYYGNQSGEVIGRLAKAGLVVELTVPPSFSGSLLDLFQTLVARELTSRGIIIPPFPVQPGEQALPFTQFPWEVLAKNRAGTAVGFPPVDRRLNHSRFNLDFIHSKLFDHVSLALYISGFYFYL